MKFLIVCNGFPPPEDLMKRECEEADVVIGADGGANILIKSGIEPNLVIGDLDSFKKPLNMDLEVIHKRDQETNDLEKALEYAKKRGAVDVVVLGAFGLRMDHSLKNLSVMKKFESTFETLVFKDKFFTAFLLPKSFQTECEKETIISLFPLSGEVSEIVTEGLKYPLNNESLKNGQRDGTSNISCDNRIKISHGHGDLVIFIEYNRSGNSGPG